MMKLEPLVSIIIPMYNTEQTIKRCLESLLKQTLKNIEIIVIDDKSIDDCSLIVKSYQKHFENISLYQNEKNIGAGATKNKGLSIAKAEIVGFLDSDDFVSENYYQNLFDALNVFDADIACSDIALVYDDSVEYSYLLKDNPFTLVHKVKGDKENGPIVIAPEIASAHWGAASAPAKLFKKNIVRSFHEGVCDDILFTFPALARAKKIVYVPGNYYFYIQSLNSLERSAFDVKRLDLAKCISDSSDLILAENSKKSDIVEIIHAFSAWPILLDILANRADRMKNLLQYFSDLKYRDLLNNVYLKTILLKKTMGEQRFIIDIIEKFQLKKFDEMLRIYEEHNEYPEYYLPKVSIVIPVYNGANYLGEAIESALAQTYPELEVLVVNDGSNDGGATERIAKAFGDRIKYYYKENGGVASALNFGIERMTGEYFSWLSHDDLYKKDKILRQIEALRICPRKETIVICGYELVNAQLEKLYNVNLLDTYKKEEVERPLFAVFKGGINGCALLIHKSHFERVGKFDVELPTTQDYELWFRMMRGEEILYLPENYVLSRSHEEQDSKKLHDKHLIECNKLWMSLFEQLTDDEMKKMEGTICDFYLSEKDFFQRTPYQKVVSYLNRKLLEFLKASPEDITPYTVEDLLKSVGLPEEILKSKKILIKVSQSYFKFAFVLSEKAFDNKLLYKNIKTVEESLGIENVIYIKVSENRKELEWIDLTNVILCPLEHMKFIPILLKLMEIKSCIFTDSSDYKQDSWYSDCFSMGIKTIAWHFKSHWMLNEKESIVGCISQIAQAQDASITIWSDVLSAQVDAMRGINAIYIPCISQEENRNVAIRCWSYVLLGKGNLSGMENSKIVEFDLLSKIIASYESFVLNNTKVIIKEPHVVEKVVYCPEERSWEEKYNGIVNSNSWRILAPYRWFADKIKKLIKNN